MAKRGKGLNIQIRAIERSLDWLLFPKKEFYAPVCIPLRFFWLLFPKRKYTKIGFLCFLGFR